MGTQHMSGTATSMWGTEPPTTYSPSVAIQGQQAITCDFTMGWNSQHLTKTMTNSVPGIAQSNIMSTDGGSTIVTMLFSMDICVGVRTPWVGII